MQITLIALIMIAFLGGMLSKCSSDKASNGSSIFNMLGFKSKESIQKEQLDHLLGKYLKDKNSLVGEIQEDIGPLSKAVREASDTNSNVDLLRLKNLMSQFEDQNVLMIEDGKDLMAFHEKQKKLNKKMADQLEHDQFLSRAAQQELIAKQKDILAQMRGNAALTNDPKLNSQLNAVYDKTVARLDAIRSQQENVNALKQQSLNNAQSVKDRMDDQKRRVEDQLRANNDRMKDQMERLKERTNR